jgi:2-aminoadipate transaminase
MTTDWSRHFASRTHLMEANAIRELLKVAARPDVISFAGGLPAAETFPVEAIREAFERIMATSGRVVLQYAPTEGYGPLREQIAAIYQARGVQATVDNVLITTGSQQGLDMVGRTLVDEHDVILTESPTYVGALQAWTYLNPTFSSVPTDGDGIQPDYLDQHTPEHTKLLYTLPNFQNPSGISLSAERRKQLVEVIHRKHIIVVEDDPYRELRYSGQDLPALVEIEAAMLGSKWDTDGRIVHLGTFSKTMAPGLRVGWMLAPSILIRMCVLAKQGADLHTSTLTQAIAEDLLRNGTMERGLPALRALYRERRDAMLNALQESIGAHGTWTRPDGGLFLWVDLAGGIDTPTLLAEAMQRKVAFVPGSAFFFDGRGSNAMRLNFSCMAPDRIREGVQRLGTLVTEQLGVAAGA